MAFAGSEQDRAAAHTGRPLAHEQGAATSRTAKGGKSRKLAGKHRCAVTGETLDIDRLFRFVAGPPDQTGQRLLVPDLDLALPGEDLWIGARRATLDAAIKSGAAAALFGQDIDVQENLPELIERLLLQRAQSGLGLARRAGVIVAGFENCRNALSGWTKAPISSDADPPPALALLASDAAPGSAEKFFRMLKGHPTAIPMRCLRVLSAAEMAQPFGRERLVQVIVEPGGVATRLEHDVIRLGLYRGESPEAVGHE